MMRTGRTLGDAKKLRRTKYTTTHVARHVGTAVCLRTSEIPVRTASKQELLDRIARLHAAVCQTSTDWDAVFIVGKINQYYFTGTMQDALFVLTRDGAHAYFVRTNADRARRESPLDTVHSIAGYGDARKLLDGRFERVYFESEVMTCGMLERIKRHFPISEPFSVDRIVQKLRAVKSPYELAAMEESGRLQQLFLETAVPCLMREGISEAEFTVALYREMMALGHQGVTRFAMFQTDMLIGQVCFGESSLYPTNFDGPGGMRGLSPYAPFIGSRERRLHKGDLVFVDVGFGVGGYHTDRTQVYRFGTAPLEEWARLHNACRDLQVQIAARLIPGNKPSEIYTEIVNGLDTEFRQNFMGYGSKTVKFLGHGVGLHIDEYPAIAIGFDEPLQEHMTIALEPKKGIKGVGMVGTEDTYAVTQAGGRCLTGGEKDIISVIPRHTRM